MNTPQRIKSFAGTVFLLPLTVLAAPAVSPAPNAQPAGPEPKTHTLFMGTDISVERDRKLYHVSDVVGSSFIIMLDGKPTPVQMGGGSHNLKLAQSMKLSSASASLTGLKGERTYTPGNDPRMIRQKEQLNVEAALDDAASLAMGRYTVAQNDLARLSAMPKGDPGTEAAIADARARADTEFKANEMANVQMDTDLASGAGARNRAESDLAKEEFDAVEVTFDVASEIPLTHPYLVAIVRFRPKDVKPGGLPNNAIYAKALDPIGSKPRTIRFSQGGFPRGYTLEDVQIHLYDHGAEIATNVAQNRVALTREEAFLYLKIEYVSRHKGATLPATPALKKIYVGANAALAPNQSNHFYFIKVSKEGMPLAAFMDEACTQPADQTIAALASTVRFYPALENGKEVAGVARVLLPQAEM